MSNIYLLSAFDDGPYAFSSYAAAVEWFIANIVQEYCQITHDADEELTELCGPNYLEPEYGDFEILLDRFEYELKEVPLDPN